MAREIVKIPGAFRPRLLLFTLVLALSGCGPAEKDRTAFDQGDSERGLALIERHGCGACHLIPGIPDAIGLVGPPLDGIANRAYLGGVLPNTLATMARWVAEPQQLSPRSAMPHVGLSEDEAKDVTAYLYTLK